MTAEKTCNSAGIISLLFPAGPSSPKTMPCNPALLSRIRPQPWSPPMAGLQTC